MVAALLSPRVDLWCFLPVFSAGGGKTGWCAEGAQGANAKQTLAVGSAASEAAVVEFYLCGLPG